MPFADTNVYCRVPGWIAFNIKDEFYSKSDRTGFSTLIDDMTDSGVFSVKSIKRYRHGFVRMEPR